MKKNLTAQMVKNAIKVDPHKRGWLIPVPEAGTWLFTTYFGVRVDTFPELAAILSAQNLTLPAQGDDGVVLTCQGSTIQRVDPAQDSNVPDVGRVLKLAVEAATLTLERTMVAGYEVIGEPDKHHPDGMALFDVDPYGEGGTDDDGEEPERRVVNNRLWKVVGATEHHEVKGSDMSKPISLWRSGGMVGMVMPIRKAA